MLGTHKLNRLGGLFDDKVKHQAGSVWDTTHIAPPLDTAQGGLRMPLIIRRENDTKRDNRN